MVQVEGPVRTAGEEHAGPALGKPDPVDRSLVALVGIQVLLVVGHGAAVQGAVLRAGYVRTGVGGMEVQGQAGSRVGNPTFTL